MAKGKAPERFAGPPEATLISVTISVLPAERARPIRERLAGVGRLRELVAAGAVLAVVGTLLAIGLSSSPARRGASVTRGQPQNAQRASVTQPRYPPRCASMTIPNINHVDVAGVERENGCAGYSSGVTASFHRTDRRWKLVLSEKQPFVSDRPPSSSLGCLTLAVAIHDPSFVGTDRATCRRGRPAWLH